ncbi:MAG: pyruvate dehydrogenase complex dihydrolipoyllysine-residue acetyltransferase [Porticoccaceae bacterium]|nr:pyruvate dehydrogenase complex dihydrolipoyllysine-residue acetyltransferase [Porticoccaceae bacterium]
MSTTQIRVPDIGADAAEVIEILVAEGEQISEEQSVIVLESDKASMEVPAPMAGAVAKLHVQVGDELSEGDLIADLVSETAVAEESVADTPTAEAVEDSPVEDVPVQPQLTESSVVAYQVPDIGSDTAEIIEVLVAVGDQISEGDSICVAESDKASLEIPAEADGLVKSIAVAVDQEVSQGDALIELEITSATQPVQQSASVTSQEGPAAEAVSVEPVASEPTEESFLVPDLGSETAEVIEVNLAVGDEVSEGDTICVAESDKASLEVPVESDGKVLAIHVAIGANISQGDKLIDMLVQPKAVAPTSVASASVKEDSVSSSPAPTAPVAPAQTTAAPAGAGGAVYAGPAVRKLARELGVDLTKVSATGTRGRILKDDLHNYVKKALQSGGTAGGEGVPAAPKVDWSKFGDVRVEPMSKIQRVTADNMSRCWLNVPHVTQFDDADVTDVEEYRQQLKAEAEERGVKMTPVAFLMKLAAKALTENPKFNSSIHEDGNTLVFRDYCHIGLAVDTPKGLMVPVIRDADQKDIWQLAEEIIDLATKAKEGKLKPNEMQGACFTISSLGAIGGKGFTPIVPAPQVGILGVSKTSIQPVWDGSAFVPRKLMPLALSYDHRAVNGGDAGRFLTYLVEQFNSRDNLS